MALIYKHIGIEDEASWGASMTGNQHTLTVTSASLNKDPGKELVETTTTTPKGRDRIVTIKNTYEGDISGYVTPRNIYHALEWVNGERAIAGSSVGANATLFDFPQNTSGTMLSKTVTLDRNVSKEKYSGVRGKSLEITFSDNLLEFTLNAMASTRSAGVSLEDIVGETVKPFAFADVTVSLHAGASYGANPVTHQVSDFSLTYDNGLEEAHLSGSADPARSDPKIPTISGNFTIFHEGTSWTDAAYGCSEFYIRVSATLPSCKGLINGTTPYVLQIDIPRTELKTSVRNYEQAELAMEEIEFEGMVEVGLSLLWRPQLTAGVSVS